MGKPQRVILFSVGQSLVSQNRDIGSIEEAKNILREVQVEFDEVALAA